MPLLCLSSLVVTCCSLVRLSFLAMWKDTDAWKDWEQEEKGMTEDEIVGWHHWLDGYEFKQALGDGEGQGSLACCSPWGRKGSDTPEWLNSNRLFAASVATLWLASISVPGNPPLPAPIPWSSAGGENVGCVFCLPRGHPVNTYRVNIACFCPSIAGIVVWL